MAGVVQEAAGSQHRAARGQDGAALLLRQQAQAGGGKQADGGGTPQALGDLQVGRSQSHPGRMRRPVKPS